MSDPAPRKREFQQLLRDVDRHFLMAARAVSDLREMVRRGDVPHEPNLLPTLHDLSPPTPSHDRPGELENAFLLRLFVAFEEGCRRCRIECFKDGREDRIQAEPLINFLANKVGVVDPLLTEVHAVRDYRNDLIHLNRDHTPIGFTTARRRLGKFLSRLPERWR